MGAEGIAKHEVRSKGEHTIACFCGDESGPTLVVVGSIHGNEPSGSQALRNVAPGLQTMESRLRGRVYFIEGNVQALKAKVRFIDSDLNRHWTKANLAKSGLVRTLGCAEDIELSELLAVFSYILG